MTRLWILGASDPEMAAIGTLLAQCGEEYAIATVDGQRVHPGCAYRMTRPLPDIWGDKKVVLVECGYDPALRIPSQRCARCGDYQWGDWAGYGDLGDDGQPVAGGMGYCGDLHEWSPTWTVVDHHRPGDPGYGRPSAEFMTASSIGQVLAILGREATQEQRLVAAADHCLAAAYRGECPGVDPDELMRWRIASRAAFQRRSEAEILADVERARESLRESVYTRRIEPYAGANGYCPHCGTADHPDCMYPAVEWRYADLRGQHIPELPEAAAREGIPFLSAVRDRDGREKVVLQAAPADLVSAFLSGSVVPGLVDIYGDPARGFAGG